MHSGFVSVVGRPNVGKSSLVNRICGTKVAIVSDKPQTTRSAIRGVLHRPADDDDEGAQIVFVDTPGIHKPRSALGPRLNATATEAMRGVDATCVVIDGTATMGGNTSNNNGQWGFNIVPPAVVTDLGGNSATGNAAGDCTPDIVC